MYLEGLIGVPWKKSFRVTGNLDILGDLWGCAVKKPVAFCLTQLFPNLFEDNLFFSFPSWNTYWHLWITSVPQNTVWTMLDYKNNFQLHDSLKICHHKAKQELTRKKLQCKTGLSEYWTSAAVGSWPVWSLGAEHILPSAICCEGQFTVQQGRLLNPESELTVPTAGLTFKQKPPRAPRGSSAPWRKSPELCAVLRPPRPNLDFLFQPGLAPYILYFCLFEFIL